MGDLLRTLSMIEQRSQVEIFADLTTISADVIRVRASEPESADGTVSLVEGVMLVQEAMDMMAAAACATVAPKPLYLRTPTAGGCGLLTRPAIGTNRAWQFRRHDSFTGFSFAGGPERRS